MVRVPPTVSGILFWSELQLSKSFQDSSAEWILSHVLGSDRRTGYREFMSAYLSRGRRRRVMEMVRRRSSSVPLQYVLGEWDFREHRILTRPPVFIPRPETEAMVDIARKYCGEQGAVLQQPRDILEIGCGSGAISISLLHAFPSAHVTAIDKSKAALRLTEHNAQLHGLRDRLSLQHCEIGPSGFRSVSGGSPLPPSSFDLVISNPPYIPSAEIPQLDESVRCFEDLGALDGGPDGLDVVRSILARLPQLLRRESVAILEVDYRHPPLIKTLVESSELEVVLSVVVMDELDFGTVGGLDASPCVDSEEEPRAMVICENSAFSGNASASVEVDKESLKELDQIRDALQRCRRNEDEGYRETQLPTCILEALKDKRIVPDPSFLTRRIDGHLCPSQFEWLMWRDSSDSLDLVRCINCSVYFVLQTSDGEKWEESRCLTNHAEMCQPEDVYEEEDEEDELAWVLPRRLQAAVDTGQLSFQPMSKKYAKQIKFWRKFDVLRWSSSGQRAGVVRCIECQKLFRHNGSIKQSFLLKKHVEICLRAPSKRSRHGILSCPLPSDTSARPLKYIKYVAPTTRSRALQRKQSQDIDEDVAEKTQEFDEDVAEETRNLDEDVTQDSQGDVPGSEDLDEDNESRGRRFLASEPLKENEQHFRCPSEEVAMAVSSLFVRSQFADLRFLCSDGFSVSCHAALMAAMSPVVQACLPSSFSAEETLVISLADFESGTVRALLELCYRGFTTHDCGSNTEDPFPELIELARLLEMRALVSVLEEGWEVFKSKRIVDEVSEEAWDTTCSEEEDQDPVHCPDCNRRTRSSVALFIHRVFNHGLKPNCPFCPARNLTRNYLRVHLWKFHSTKKFRCKICSKEMKNLPALHHHHEVVHQYYEPGPEYPCVRCDLSFARKRSMQLHLKQQHGEKSMHKICPVLAVVSVEVSCSNVVLGVTMTLEDEPQFSVANDEDGASADQPQTPPENQDAPGTRRHRVVLPDRLQRAVESGAAVYVLRPEPCSTVWKAFRVLRWRNRLGVQGETGYVRCLKCLRHFIHRGRASGTSHLWGHLALCQPEKAVERTLPKKRPLPLENTFFPTKDEVPKLVESGEYFWDNVPHHDSKKRSKVWRDFQILRSVSNRGKASGFVRCRHCHHLLCHWSPHISGTTMLMNHLSKCRGVAYSSLKEVVNVDQALDENEPTPGDGTETFMQQLREGSAHLLNPQFLSEMTGEICKLESPSVVTILRQFPDND
ncbi:unnamed protein product, partial [Cyprideis torosa]